MALLPLPLVLLLAPLLLLAPPLLLLLAPLRPPPLLPSLLRQVLLRLRLVALTRSHRRMDSHTPARAPPRRPSSLPTHSAATAAARRRPCALFTCRSCLFSTAIAESCVFGS